MMMMGSVAGRCGLVLGFVGSVSFLGCQSSSVEGTADATAQADSATTLDTGPISSTGVCGDGVCDPNETQDTCPEDCTPPVGCLADNCGAQQLACMTLTGCISALGCAEACADHDAACRATCGTGLDATTSYVYGELVACGQQAGCFGGSAPSCSGRCGDGNGICSCAPGCDLLGNCCPDYRALCEGAATCGDGICQGDEPQTCPDDCTSPECGPGTLAACHGPGCVPAELLGDGQCSERLDCDKYAFDDGDCASSCGDGVCDAGEQQSCPRDCSGCPEGTVPDCANEQCVPSEWVGDGECDPPLNCARYGNDGGDCEATGGCEEGFTLTCNRSACAPEAWIGDGECQGFMNCEQYNDDGGDCDGPGPGLACLVDNCATDPCLDFPICSAGLTCMASCPDLACAQACVDSMQGQGGNFQLLTAVLQCSAEAGCYPDAGQCGNGFCEGDEEQTCPEDCEAPGCPDGTLPTCNGQNCIPSDLLGNGQCDPPLNCEDHGNDGGDCEDQPLPECLLANCDTGGCANNPNCLQRLLCIEACDDVQCAEQCIGGPPQIQELLAQVIACGAQAGCLGGGGPVCGNGACEDGENGESCPQDCDPGTNCGEGFVPTCNGTACAPEEWIGDTTCQGFLNCDLYNADGGDCEGAGPGLACLTDNCDVGPCLDFPICSAGLNCMADCPDQACAQACVDSMQGGNFQLLSEVLACGGGSGCWEGPGPICGDGACNGDENPETCPQDCEAPGCPQGMVEACQGDACIPVDAIGNGACDDALFCEAYQFDGGDCDDPGPLACLLDNCDVGNCQDFGGCNAGLECIAGCETEACADECVASAPGPAQTLLGNVVVCAVGAGCLEGTPGPVCGDGQCEPDETPQSCPDDCDTGPECGDGVCEGDETPQSCPQDCDTGVQCGDGFTATCNGTACAPAEWIGNNVCNGFLNCELYQSDGGDCAGPGPGLACLVDNCATDPCLDFPICSAGLTCMAECPDAECAQACVDAMQGGNFQLLSGVLACGIETCWEVAGPECGNGVCEDGEDFASCPDDCDAPGCPDNAVESCGGDACIPVADIGNNVCDDALNCEANQFDGGDCDTPDPLACLLDNCNVGNCLNFAGCTAGLNCIAACDNEACADACVAAAPGGAQNILGEVVICAVEVGCVEGTPGPECGDGQCEDGETFDSCPLDCEEPNPCGNDVCDPGETSDTCPQDCPAGPECGNGVCETGEDDASCPADCDENPPSELTECLEDNCANEFAACLAEPVCAEAYVCVEGCVANGGLQCTFQCMPPGFSQALLQVGICGGGAGCGNAIPGGGGAP